MPSYVDGSNGIVTTGNISATGNITGNYFIGNGSQLTGIAAGNVDLGNINQDVIPSANVTYSLGNATNQWKDLWISNNTIYINSLPLSTVEVGNVATIEFNGNPIVVSSNTAPPQTANIATTAAVVANEVVANSFSYANGAPFTGYTDADVSTYLASGNNTAGYSTTGNVTANFFIGDGSQLTNLPAGDYSNANVEAYLPTSPTIIAINSNVANTNANVANLVTDLGNTNANVINLDNAIANTNSNVANVNTALANTNANVANTNANVGNVQLSLIAGEIALANTDANVANVASNVTTLQGQVYANANVSAYLGNAATTGNIFATNITASNAITATTFIGNFQGNITGNLVVPGANTWVLYNQSGNAGADIGFRYDASTEDVFVGNTVTANFFIGDGSQLTGLPAAYGNANVEAYLPTSNTIANINGNVNNVIISLNNTNSNVANTNANVATLNNTVANLATATSLANTNANVANTNANVANLTSALGNTNSNVDAVSNAVITLSQDTADAFANTNANVANLSSDLANTDSNVANLTTTVANLATASSLANTNANVANLTSALGNTNANVANLVTITTNTNANVANLTTSLSNTNANVANTNANVANIASNVTTLQGQVYANANAQAYLASNANVVVTTTGNITTAANVQANFFIGNGSQLTGVTATSVAANALTGNTLSANVLNSSLTSLGTLNSLAVTGTTDLGDVNASGAVVLNGVTITETLLTTTGSGFEILGTDQGVQLQSLDTANSTFSLVFADNTGVGLVTDAGEIIVGIDGNVTVTDSMSVGGELSTVGNITASYFIGNGSQLTGLPVAYGNANVEAYLPVSNTIVAINANVANTNANVANTNSNVANLTTSLSNTNANVANTNANVANLTTSLSNTNANVANTNSNVANLTTSLSNTNSNVANVASNVTTLQGQVYANANVAAYLASNANVAITTTGNITTTANISGAYILGNGSQLTGLPVAYGNAEVSAYLASGNNAGGFGTSGDITANNIVADGGLSSLGNASYFANLTVTVGNIDASTTNVIAGFLYGDGSNIANLNLNPVIANILTNATSTNANVSNIASNVTTLQGQVYANANVAAYLLTNTGNIQAGNALITGNLVVQGTTTTVNSNNVAINDLVFTVANNANSASFANGAGLGVGPADVYATFLWSSASDTWTSSNNLSAVGNIQGNFILGNGSQLTGLPATYGNANVATYLASNANVAITTTGAITTTANVTANIVTVANLISNTGNSQIELGNGIITMVAAAGTMANLTVDGVRLGFNAGGGFNANIVAIGTGAASLAGGNNAVIIGYDAVQWGAGANTIVIGYEAGQSTFSGPKIGANTIAIGTRTGFAGAPANSIVLNATGANFSPSTTGPQGLFINPVRNDTGNVANVVYYNATTKELTYAPPASALPYPFFSHI